MEKIQRKFKGKHLTPVRSIKLYCKEMCCAGDLESWKNCTFDACFLFKYRMGKRGTTSNKKQIDNSANSDKNNVLQETSK